MHSRATILAVIALVAAGLPLTLAAPVDLPDSDLDIRELSSSSIGALHAFQTRDEIPALEPRAKDKNISKNGPPKETSPQLSVKLTTEDEAALKNFLQTAAQGKNLVLQGVHFDIGNEVVIVTDVGKTAQSYTMGAVRKLLKGNRPPAKGKPRYRRDLSDERFDAFRVRAEIPEVQARSGNSKKPSTTRKTSKVIKAVKPILSSVLKDDDKSQLKNFLTEAKENSTITIGGVTFTIEDGNVEISTDQGVLYDISAVMQLTQ